MVELSCGIKAGLVSLKAGTFRLSCGHVLCANLVELKGVGVVETDDEVYWFSCIEV